MKKMPIFCRCFITLQKVHDSHDSHDTKLCYIWEQYLPTEGSTKSWGISCIGLKIIQVCNFEVTLCNIGWFVQRAFVVLKSTFYTLGDFKLTCTYAAQNCNYVGPSFSQLSWNMFALFGYGEIRNIIRMYIHWMYCCTILCVRLFLHECIVFELFII